MQNVLVDLKEDWYSLSRILPLQELARQNISVECWSGSFSERKGILLLTDNPKTAALARHNKIACIGVEQPEGQRIYGPAMVIQGVEGITADLLITAYKRFHQIPLVISETGRLQLRESVAEDAAAFYEMYCECGSLEIMAEMPDSAEAEQAQLLHYVKWMYPFYGYGLWSVVEKSSGKVIGRAGLEHRTFKGQEVIELGYLIHAGKRRQGYGREAAEAICCYAFSQLDMERLYVFIQRGNDRSVKLAEYLGFREIAGDDPALRVFFLMRDSGVPVQT